MATYVQTQTLTKTFIQLNTGDTYLVPANSQLEIVWALGGGVPASTFQISGGAVGVYFTTNNGVNTATGGQNILVPPGCTVTMTGSGGHVVGLVTTYSS